MTSARARGFTLIELAVVIAIIGLLVAGAFTSFGAIRTNAKLRETHQTLETVERVLFAFVARHGRLPCPARPDLTPADAGYGREINVGGFGVTGAGEGCNAALRLGATGVFRGVFPAASMGRSTAALTDGWDQQLIYYVVGSAAGQAFPFYRPPVENFRWALEGDNEIELWDKAQADTSMPAARQLVNLGVAAVVSTGPNQHGGITRSGQQLPPPRQAG